MDEARASANVNALRGHGSRVKMSIARYAVAATALTIWLLAGSGCSASEEPAPTPADRTPAPQPAQVAGLDSERLRNALIGGVFEEAVRLEDGLYEGEPFVEGGASRPRLRLWDAPVLRLDVDGDGSEEAAVLLSESSGGSGEHVYLSVIANRDGEARSLATTLVGDRTRLRSMEASNGRIILEVVEAGSEDAACCPTQLARKAYALEAATLRLDSSQVTGRLSLAVLEGVEWTLESLNGDPVPDGVQAPTLVFAGGNLGGFAGCNRYTGQASESAPGQLVIGPLAATRMACPAPAAETEDHFLARLQQVTQYSFLGGRLALTWRGDTRIGTLIFVASPKR